MSRIYQNVILQLKELYGRRLGVIDTTGTVTACTYGILDNATVEHILKNMRIRLRFIPITALPINR